METLADSNELILSSVNDLLEVMFERDDMEGHGPKIRTVHLKRLVEEVETAIENGAPDIAYNHLNKLLNTYSDEERSPAEESLIIRNLYKLRSSLADELGIDIEHFEESRITHESDLHNIPLINKIFNERISEFKYEIKLAQDSINQTQVEATRRNHEMAHAYKHKTETIDKLISDTEYKHESINQLLESAAGRVIASDYQKSAANEKNTADKLRYTSLGFMFVAAGVLILTVFESTGSGFSIESSAFRLLTAALLSVPAAYLARESARHREQQYLHHQTSLDLITITPYIATLPDEMQHDIKADIAKRIFASRQPVQQETYNHPLNTQEVLIELIKKLEPRKPTTKSSTASEGSEQS